MMKSSRLFFAILFVISSILAITVFLRWIKNRDLTELIQKSSNVAYTKWQLPDGAKARLGKGSINDIKFAPDGTRFAVATSIGVWMYDAETGTEISLFKGDRQKIKGIAFLSDGRTLIGINSSAEILKWNIESGELQSIIRNEEFKSIYTAFFSEDGTKLATISNRFFDAAQVWHIDDKMSSQTITKVEYKHNTGRLPIIALAPNKRMIATAIYEGKDVNPIFLWDANTGKRLFTLTGHERWIRSLTFSPDSKLLASADEYHSVKLWDIDTNTSRATFKAPVSFKALAFSPNGKILASGGHDGSVRLWNAEGKQDGWKSAFSKILPIHTIKKHKDNVYVLAYSSEGDLLLTGSDDGTIRAWNTTTGKLQYTCPGHTSVISGIAASGEGNTLVSMHSRKNQLLHWDIEMGHHLSGFFYKWKSPEAISPNAMTIAIKDWKGKNSLKLWNTSKKRLQANLIGHQYMSLAKIPYLKFSSDGNWLASSIGSQQGSVIHLWDLAKQQRSFFEKLFSSNNIHPKYTYDIQTDRTSILAFSPSGGLLASSGADAIIRVWDLKTGSLSFTLMTEHIRTIRALTFSEDGKTIASCGNYKDMSVWDVPSRQKLAENKTVETAKILQFSSDGKTIISGTDNGKIQLLDAHTLHIVSTHIGHTNFVNALLFIDDGKTLVSASSDGTIMLWDWERIKHQQN